MNTPNKQTLLWATIIAFNICVAATIMVAMLILPPTDAARPNTSKLNPSAQEIAAHPNVSKSNTPALQATAVTRNLGISRREVRREYDAEAGWIWLKEGDDTVGINRSLPGYVIPAGPAHDLSSIVFIMPIDIADDMNIITRVAAAATAASSWSNIGSERLTAWMMDCLDDVSDDNLVFRLREKQRMIVFAVTADAILTDELSIVLRVTTPDHY